MGQISFLKAGAFFLIFAIAITAFATNFANDNGTSVSITNNSNIQDYKDNLDSQVTVVVNEANGSSQAFFESTVGEGDETTVTGGQFKVGLTGFVNTIKDTASVAYSSIFGSGEGFGFVFTIFGSVLAIIAFLFIWKTWKGGLPD